MPASRHGCLLHGARNPEESRDSAVLICHAHSIGPPGPHARPCRWRAVPCQAVLRCGTGSSRMDGQQQQHALLESCSAPASAAQRHARTGCTGRGMILPTEADHQAAAQLAVEGARGMTLSHHVLCVADAKSHWPLGGYSTHCALHRRRLERAGGLVG